MEKRQIKFSFIYFFRQESGLVLHDPCFYSSKKTSDFHLKRNLQVAGKNPLAGGEGKTYNIRYLTTSLMHIAERCHCGLFPDPGPK